MPPEPAKPSLYDFAVSRLIAVGRRLASLKEIERNAGLIPPNR
jgi:hypothetical protein